MLELGRTARGDLAFMSSSILPAVHTMSASPRRGLLSFPPILTALFFTQHPFIQRGFARGPSVLAATIDRFVNARELRRIHERVRRPILPYRAVFILICMNILFGRDGDGGGGVGRRGKEWNGKAKEVSGQVCAA